MSIYLGTEWLTCPRCKRPVRLDVMHDLPAQDWLECRACNYRSMLNFTPILDKYGIPHGLSKPESQDIANRLPNQTDIIRGGP